MKFKKIEIDAFRAFESKEGGTFDFTCGDSSRPANLVAIYAPNGFGKTSFYDAVEWGMTNRISRLDYSYNENLARAESEFRRAKHGGKKKKQYILKNREAVNKEQGKVTITFDNNEIIEKETRELKRGWNDYYYSPTPKIENSYFKDVILSQEGIDAFLRIENPEERYNKFVDFFFNLNKADKLFKNISELINISEDKLGQNKKDIKLLEEEIESQKIDGDIIEETNRIIDELPGLQITGYVDEQFLSSIENLRENFNSTNIHQFNSRLNEAIACLTLKETGIEDEQKGIEELLSEFPDYTGKQEDLEKLERINTIKNDTQAKEEELSKLNGRLGASLELKEIFPNYIKTRESIESIKENISELEKQDNDDERNFMELNGEIEKIKVERESKQTELEELKTERGSIEKRFEFYTQSLEQKKGLIDDLNAHKEKLNSYRDDHSQLNQKSTRLKNLKIEAEEGYAGKLKDIPGILITYIGEVKLHREMIDQLSTDLKSLREKAESLGSLRDIHGKIIALGKKYITGTETVKCPLCAEKEYKNYNALLTQIEKSNVLAEINGGIEKEILQCKEKIKEAQIQCENALGNFRKEVDREIEEIDKKLNSLGIIITEKSGQMKELNRRIIIENDKILQYEGRFKDKQINDIKLELDAKIETLNRDVQSKIKLLKQKEQEKVEIQNTRIENRKNLDLKEKGAARLKTGQEFVTYIKLIEMHPFLQNREPETIDHQVDEFEEKIKGIEMSIEKNRKDIFELEKVLKGELILKGKKLQNLNQKLDALKAQMDDIGKFFNLGKMAEELSVLKKERKRLSSIKRMLEKNKESLKNHIEPKINKFFEEKLINEIYKRIEPHPEYKDIKFRTDLSGAKPRLNIYLEKENSAISPNLFFSTAQVNILSLSIFLARALKAEDDKGKAVDTIFIDDPVQSMDSINVLSVIDLIRTIIIQHDKQVVVSTHDENFFRLIRKKIPGEYYSSKFIEFETFGKVKTLKQKRY